MKTTLDQFILAVEAELALVTIACQTEEQEDVVRDALEPEGERIDVGVRAQ